MKVAALIAAAILTLFPVSGCTRSPSDAAPRPSVVKEGPALVASASSVPEAKLAPTASAVAAEVSPAPAIALPTEGPFKVIDLHVDTPWRVHFKGRPLSLPKGHATPGLVRRGHYAAIVYPIYIPDYIHNSHPTIADADAIYDTIDKLVAAHALFVPAMGPEGAKEVGPDKVGVFVAIEGAGAFAEDITQIDRFIRRGVRLVGPVHARDNKLASSATGKKGGYGLTELGKAFCGRVYAAGALVDVSHMSDAAFDDLVAVAAQYRAPVVATHSNARALAKHKRNLTDAQLRTIAQTGGLAGLNLHRSFVRRGKARLRHLVAQVLHMVEVAGVDHVAIGSDFDGGRPVAAVKNAAKLPDLAKALGEAGMSDADIRKVFAQNALRVLSWRRPAPQDGAAKPQ